MSNAAEKVLDFEVDILWGRSSIIAENVVPKKRARRQDHRVSWFRCYSIRFLLVMDGDEDDGDSMYLPQTKALEQVFLGGRRCVQALVPSVP